MQNWYNLDTVHSALIAARCDVARLFAEEDAPTHYDYRYDCESG